MWLVIVGALLFAAGVGWIFPPAGVMVLGLEAVAAGVFLDLTDDDEPAEADE